MDSVDKRPSIVRGREKKVVGGDVKQESAVGDHKSLVETKPFSAAKHIERLRSTITEMINGDQIKSFLGQFHTDDLQTLHIVLTMLYHHPKNRDVAIMLDKVIHAGDVHCKGIVPHTREEIKHKFMDFSAAFLLDVDKRLSARDLLGLGEGVDLEESLIKKHVSELYIAQMTRGTDQSQAFIRNLISRASLQLGQELAKMKQEKEQTPPEPWLDIEREKIYSSLIADLEKMSHSEQIAWLGLTLECDFSEEESKRINISFVKSEDSSRIANFPIKRPVVECDDAETVVLLAKKAGHLQPERVGGFVLKGGRLKKKGLGEISLIVTSKNPDTVKHEVRHSIEPRTRSGMDHALSEIFAYAERYVKNGEWQKLEDLVVDEVYFNSYKTLKGAVPIDMQEQYEKDERIMFRNQVHRTVEQFAKRTAEVGEILALRELLTIGSVQEYYDEEFRKTVAEFSARRKKK